MECESRESKRRREEKEEKRRKRKKEKEERRQAERLAEKEKDISSLLTPKDEQEAERIIESIAKPRITPFETAAAAPTPSSTAEDTIATLKTQVTEAPLAEIQSPRTETAITETPSAALLESALRTLFDAQFVKVSADIEALEQYRSALLPYVSANARAVGASRKKRPIAHAAVSADTGAKKKRKKSGYNVFIEELRTLEGGKLTLAQCGERWRSMTFEEKQVYVDKARAEEGPSSTVEGLATGSAE